MLIVPGIHQIKLGFVNAYLIEESQSLTLIDTGIPNSHKKIIAYIESIGRKVTDIKTILITHSDPDHIGSLAKLKELSGAKIYSSAIEAEDIKDGLVARQSKQKGFKALIYKILLSTLMKIKPVGVDKILKDNDVLPIFKGLVIVSSSGHTFGHVSFFLKVPKVLFCGDSMNGIDGKLTSSKLRNTANVRWAEESFEKQKRMNPSIICCGHGQVIKP